MRIIFLSVSYPSTSRKSGESFVQQFVWAMARQGHNCIVINPMSIFDRRKGILPDKFSIEDAGNGKTIQIIRPRFLSFSSMRLGWIHTGRWSNALYTRSAWRCISSIKRPDIIYGHFMYPAGFTAVFAGQRLNLPSIVGVGEGEFWTIESVGVKRAKRELEKASAFLSVSTYISESLVNKIAIHRDKISVFPNGVNLDRFQPISDRIEQCRKLGLPSNTFNIGYIGPPIAQKGYPQLRDAVAGMSEVRLVLLGRGMDAVYDQQVAFAGAVPHSAVSSYLGVCDIFVLPTAIEGSCNSVIEAMACGLPIVTSNGKHMDDLVDFDVAIRVDENDTNAIRNAIIQLKNNPEQRKKMSQACLLKSKQFDINERASRVTEWLKDITSKFILKNA